MLKVIYIIFIPNSRKLRREIICLITILGYDRNGIFLNNSRSIKEYDDDTGKIVNIHTWKNGMNDGIGTLYFSN